MKQWSICMVVISATFLTGCASSVQLQQELPLAQLEQAFANQNGWLFLRGDRVIPVDTVVVSSDSVHYNSGEVSAAAVSIAEIIRVEVTRERRPWRVTGNLLGGMAAGAAIGLIARRSTEANIPEDCGTRCLGSTYAVFYTPVGIVSGLLIGALINSPIPRDRFVFQRDVDGSWRLAKLTN